MLSNVVRPPPTQPTYQPSPPQPPPQQQAPQYEEDMGYRTMTREDVAIIQERRISSALVSPQQQTSPLTPQNNIPAAPALPPAAPPAPSPLSPPGHQRTVSAPPAPPPPPAAAPPPPPPPPMQMSRSQSSDGGEVNSLAAQLQNARLKRNSKVSMHTHTHTHKI